MKQGKGRRGPTAQGAQSETAESPWERIEQERTALAAERERFEAERAAWQVSVAELEGEGAPDVEARIAQQQARLDIHRRELEEGRATLTSRQAEIDSVQLDLDQRETALEQQRRDIARDNEDLTKAREEVQRLSGSLEADQAGRQVDRLAEFYQQQQAEIDAERHELQSLHEQVRQERAELRGELQQLKDGRADLERRAAALEEQQQQLETERKGFQQQREQLVVERSELGEDQAKLESMQGELARRQAQLEQELLELRGQRDRVAGQQEHLGEQRASLEAEQAALANRSEGIERQRVALTAQREKLLARQEELEAEHAECRNVREQLQQEGEQYRAELRQKVEQFEAQLTQVTERGRQLSARQRELDDRDQALQEAERQAADEEARRRAEVEAEQKDLDQRRQETEAEEARLASAREEFDQRAAELDERIAGFSADRERILGMQNQFDARSEELDGRNQHLDRVEAELNQQRDQLEGRRNALQAKETSLAQREEVFANREQALAEAEQQAAARQAALRGETEDLTRRESALAERAADVARREEELGPAHDQIKARRAELKSRSAEVEAQADQLQADRRQLDQERQDAAREAAGERQVLEQQREALGRQEANLTERERRLAGEVEALQKSASGEKADRRVKQIVVEAGGFSLQRALVASTVLAAVSAIVVVAWLGFRHQVEGIIRIDTEGDPEQVLPQHAAMLNTPWVIETAAEELDADLSPADIATMMGVGGEIQVKMAPEDKEIRLVAVSRDASRAKAVLQALGDALVNRIESRATSAGPSEELQRLQAALTRAKTQLQQDETMLARAEQKAGGATAPDPPVDQLDKQFEAAQAQWDRAKQAWLAAEKALSGFASSRPAVEVDTDMLREAIRSDAQHRQDSEECRLRAQQLRSLLLEGLQAAQAPLASLSERIEAFDRAVARRVKDKPSDGVLAELGRIRTSLAACRKTTDGSAKAWNRLSDKLRQQDDAKTAQSILADQKQAEKLLSDFVDQLRAPITEIHKQVQTVAQSGGGDTTRRIVIQDMLRKQTEALTSALREFANAGAEVIPMSHQRLDACIRQVRQLRERLNEREERISAGMAQRARDQAAESQAKRLAALRRRVAEQADARGRALAGLLGGVGQLVRARTQQSDFENARNAVKFAAERVERSKTQAVQAEAQVAEFRAKAGTMFTSDRRDRASFTGAGRVPGLANRRELVHSAGGVAVFVFAVSWLVTWVVGGGRSAVPAGRSRGRAGGR